MGVESGLIIAVAGMVGGAITGLIVWIARQRAHSEMRDALELTRREEAIAKEALRQGEERRLKAEAAQAEAERDVRGLELGNQQLRSALDEAIRRRDEALTAFKAAEAQRVDLYDKAGGLGSRVATLEQRLNDAENRESVALQKVDALEAERRSLEKEKQKLSAEFATSQSELANLQIRLDEQKAWIVDTTQAFEQKLLAASARVMEERGKSLSETSRKEVEGVVAPFREKLDEFRQRVDLIYDAENKERGELRQQILQLTALNQTVSSRAEQLTNALTIRSKSTGNWGETILARILEESGLRENHEYRLQAQIRGSDGESLIPDAVINLPGKRQLIVDSKVSNLAWTNYCASGTDGDARSRHLSEHLKSLRKHVSDLGKKDYSRSPDLSTVDFVLMFVPVEAALLTALQEDESLYGEAYRSKVILVTPSTLMAVVKLAEGLWTLQRRKESADEIAELGRRLYEKLSNFARTFEAVGNAIDDARRSFDQAKGQLATGRGNAIRLAEQMRERGVSPSSGKVMPPSLLAGNEADPAEASSGWEAGQSPDSHAQPALAQSDGLAVPL